MKYFPFILCFGFFLSCGRPSETQVDTMCFDLDKLYDDVRFSDLFERVDLIPLETSDSSLLTPAVILAAYHDTIYVMDFMQNKDIKVMIRKENTSIRSVLGEEDRMIISGQRIFR